MTPAANYVLYTFMASTPTLTEPEDASHSDIEAAQTESHLVILDELCAIGMNLARRIEAQVTTDNLDTTARAYERVACAIRRSIMLSHRIENAPSAAARHAARQAAEAKARSRAQRPAAIAGTAKHTAKPSAPRASRDRLESIGNDPTHEIIARLCRDMVKAAKPLFQPLKTKPPLAGC